MDEKLIQLMDHLKDLPLMADVIFQTDDKVPQHLIIDDIDTDNKNKVVITLRRE